MKTKPEIEAAIRELEIIRDSKCDCAEQGGAHAERCNQGSILVNSQIDILEWIIDRPNSFDDLLRLMRMDRNTDASQN